MKNDMFEYSICRDKICFLLFICFISGSMFSLETPPLPLPPDMIFSSLTGCKDIYTNCTLFALCLHVAFILPSYFLFSLDLFSCISTMTDISIPINTFYRPLLDATCSTTGYLEERKQLQRFRLCLNNAGLQQF
jgi:hypothetical protein